MYAQYGAAGKVAGNNGDAIADALVRISRENGDVVVRATTNQFGYYRIDGLRSGIYTAEVESVRGISMKSTLKQEFRIENDYVFDIDLKAALP